jgi:exonuclease VII large subunit
MKKENVHNKEITIDQLAIMVSNGFNGMAEIFDKKLGYLEQRLDGKLGDLEQRLDEKLGDLEQRLDGELENLEQRLDGKLSDLEQRLDGKLENLEQRLDGKLENLEQGLVGKLENLKSELERDLASKDDLHNVSLKIDLLDKRTEIMSKNMITRFEFDLLENRVKKLEIKA